MNATHPVIIQDEQFKRMVMASVALHVLIFFSFFIKNVFFQSEPTIFESAIKVDMVALPDKVAPLPPASSTANEKPQPAPVPTLAPKVEVKKAEAPKPTAISLKKETHQTKKEQERALQKLKALEALENLSKSEDSAKHAKTNPYKGNVVSSGTQLRGLSRMEYESYISEVDQHIKTKWRLPEWLAKSELKAVAVVKFEKSGQVTYRALLKSSGNANYDNLVLDAIDEASPFPIPPDKFIEIVRTNGIQFEFP